MVAVAEVASSSTITLSCGKVLVDVSSPIPLDVTLDMNGIVDIDGGPEVGP